MRAAVRQVVVALLGATLGLAACGGKVAPGGPVAPADPGGPGEVFDCCCFAGEGSVEPMERAACTELGGECLKDGERCGASEAGGDHDDGDPGEY